ncbi:hypothetical protein [Microbacterium telephonicum]|uniref:Uncharacterized protein n=1 Tax=Microbacterium telephonicum TaxID=1714841 RepID=A0A498CDD5_9MICO|nr:hypothetical protein [Microbacterium telephonicum]RLK53047.1 hypothetical protein C7474_1009 [Microbacterium telephonicum]
MVPMPPDDPALALVWSILLAVLVILLLAAALVLVVVSLRRPTVIALSVATGLLLGATVLTAFSPVDVPLLVGVIVALLAGTVGVLGGNPVTRLVLRIATGGRVRETSDGGIFLVARGGASATADDEERALLRGGTTIGYLERLAVVLSIIVGYPEAIAVVVAIKGVGRFSELAAAEARERFIIGTLASLLWAAVAGALVRLAVW